MSLYYCFDLLTQEQQKLESSPSFWRTLPFLTKPVSQPCKHFLSKLKGKLQQRIQDENYENLNDEIELIIAYLEEQMPAANPKFLEVILQDLKTIHQNYQQPQRSETIEILSALQESIPCSVVETYRKYRKENCIAEINQAELFKLGTSPGECLGFTYSMANPKLSPYINKDIKIDFNQKTHDYQKGQFERAKDQQTIKRTRITRFYFYPNPTEQAKMILNLAEKYQDKDLKLTKKGSAGKHACYLSIRKEGEIWYMDPNHGAFCFDNTNDFINFYDTVAQFEKAAEIQFRFFNLDELRYDEKMELTELKTWEGLLRTFIMGSKYHDNRLNSNRLIMAFYAVGGAILGAGFGSLIPGIGTSFGAAIGAALGAALAASLCGLAFIRGHLGLLSIPHLLMDKWQDVREKISELSSQNSHELHSGTELNSESNSTKGILLKMPPSKKDRASLETKQIERPNSTPRLSLRFIVTNSRPLAADDAADNPQTASPAIGSASF